MSTRVVLADDHTLVRAGIRALLEAMPGVEVVGEAADGEQLLERVRATRPDVVLMDLAMPRMNGLEATTRLRAELPETRVIVLSMHATADYVEQAIRAGAAGYMIKDAATQELALAIASVAGGGTWISPAASALMLPRLIETPKPPAAEALTPRQTEILTLIAQGRSTKEIAYELELSSKTVENHRAQLMERLGIRDIAGLVRYAIRIGLVADD